MTRHGTILIVDDDPEIREGVDLWLTSVGYQTRRCINGEECLAAVREEQPDLILLDVLMPVRDGFSTLHQLKSQVVTASIPVVMFSANLRDQQKALDAGAEFFVEKPYEGRDLIHTIDCTLQQSRGPAGPVAAPVR